MALNVGAMRSTIAANRQRGRGPRHPRTDNARGGRRGGRAVRLLPRHPARQGAGDGAGPAPCGATTSACKPGKSRPLPSKSRRAYEAGRLPGDPAPAEHRLRLVLVLHGDRLRAGDRTARSAAGRRAPGLLSKAQRRSRWTIEGSPSQRGTIRDRNGLPIAQQGVVQASCLARPAEIEDPEATAAFIAQKLGLQEAQGSSEKDGRAAAAVADRGGGCSRPSSCTSSTPTKVADILADDPPGLFADRRAAPRLPVPQAGGAGAGLHRHRGIHGRPNGAGLEYSLDPVLRGTTRRAAREVRAPGGAPMESFTLAGAAAGPRRDP